VAAANRAVSVCRQDVQKGDPVSIFFNVTVKGRVVGPAGMRVRRHEVSDKKTFFGRNAPQIVISIIVPLFCHHKILRVGLA
jgi:hypothetical protein